LLSSGNTVYVPVAAAVMAAVFVAQNIVAARAVSIPVKLVRVRVRVRVSLWETLSNWLIM
jgi:hypothetical protein